MGLSQNARGEEGRRQIRKDLESAMQRLGGLDVASVIKRWKTKTFDYPGRAPGKFGGTLIVLSDRKNGSAGESFARLAKSLSGTVVMGENSSGVNTFCPIHMYPLPHSRLKLTMGWAINHSDGKIFEGKGYAPDIWIDEADALPVAISYAKSVLGR
jgi:C-terminal processing protease CtpA/Prc